MIPPPANNGLQATVAYLSKEVDKLWEEKASREALANALGDIGEIKTALQGIQEVMAARPFEREQERKAVARERKIDRRWMVGTVLTGVGLLIGAMAILLPALSGGG